jgi:hypothetical protein
MDIPICPVWFPCKLPGRVVLPVGGPAIRTALNPQPLPPGIYFRDGGDGSVRF